MDDEPDIADLFRQHFRREARQGTYVMHFAGSGEQALGMLAGEIEPTLIVILSDINMPGILMSERTAASVGSISPESRSNASEPEAAKCIT